MNIPGLPANVSTAQHVRPNRAIAAWFASPLQWVAWLFRTFYPIPHLFVPISRWSGWWAAVTRFEDVAEVLSRPDVFAVPFAAEIARLNDGQAPGTPFILGIDDKREHDRQLKLVMQAFPRGEVASMVTSIARDAAQNAVRAAAHKATAGASARIDAIRELITDIPITLCERYYGVPVPIPDRERFAANAMDVSGHLFGLPPIKPDPAIDNAADVVRAVVDAAIQLELSHPSARSTVLARLITTHKADPSHFPIELVRAFLMGMIIGFVPTNTIAGGHILEKLLRNEAFMKAAREAALAGDDDLLERCLFEAMRFWPLNPGPFRICTRDFVVAADTRRAKNIRKGTKVLASTCSAMFDSRQVKQPFYFDPDRAASDYMLFGYGMHWCVGIFIAQAQITQTFKALLVQRNLRSAPWPKGKLKLRGIFPDHLFVEFDRVKQP
ncbi:MAG TPA: cytochrome P450 [Casimicrobiaceae bacterium]|nr:cytochrome P450 [Casimicrobiaceae bacterium]